MKLREFLSYCFLIALLVQGLSFLFISGTYAMPRTPYVNIGLIDEFPPSSEPYLVELKDHPTLWLVNLGTDLRAFRPRSPDGFGCIYAWSTVTLRFEDSCLGSKFTLEGHYIEGPAWRNLDQYQVHIKQAQVQVDPSRVILGAAVHPNFRPVGSICGYRIYFQAPSMQKRVMIVPKQAETLPAEYIVRDPVYCPSISRHR